MTDVLDLDNTKNVLEIGTGSGYQAAVLGDICKQVYTIELVEILGRRAENLFKELNYNNIKTKNLLVFDFSLYIFSCNYMSAFFLHRTFISNKCESK